MMFKEFFETGDVPMKMLISGTVLICGVWSGGIGYIEDWVDVIWPLKCLQKAAGILCLDLINPPEPAPISIFLESDNNTYLITLLEDVGDDLDVRACDNPTATAQMVEVLGDYWDARMLTDDFDLVVMLFKEFFETGECPAIG
jgi:hypothetical protein